MRIVVVRIALGVAGWAGQHGVGALAQCGCIGTVWAHWHGVGALARCGHVGALGAPWVVVAHWR
jgi:hypothetical protein